MDCPLPKFDFDVITLGHGSGGLLTHRLLQSGVFDVFNNEFLNQQHDGAIFSLEGKLAMSTDSYVVSPIFFPGGNIGDLAVNGTVNDLAMCGADARYLTLSFIIEEGLPMQEFARILQTIKQASDQAAVQIITGDTKVVERGKGDKIFINTTGIGVVHPRAIIHHEAIRETDVIILSGAIAAHGIAIMSQREGLRFETDIISDTQPLKNIVLQMLDTFGEDIHFLRDATRGGVASVLNEVAGLTRLGFAMQQTDIPIAEAVEGACEMLGLDPLYVANEGLFVAIVNARIAPELLAMLRQNPASEQAAIVGTVSREHPGKVVMKSAIGGSRVVNFLTGEQLPRIC